jgi:hypothetical protein
MKMGRLVLVAAAVAVAVVIAACGGAPRAAPAADEDLPPPGTERLMLENGAYAIFRFDLPPGTVWADFDRISADYMVNEINMARAIRHWRLMGNWREEHFEYSAATGVRFINFGDGQLNPFGTGTYNGPFIMENNMGTPPWDEFGAVANEWFTITYGLTGERAHAQFDRVNAIPAADETGPFFFGLGLAGDGHMNAGTTQYIRNVTLHHRSDPSLSVVSTGSGFDGPAFGSFPPVMSRRLAGPPLPAVVEAVAVEEEYEYDYE